MLILHGKLPQVEDIFAPALKEVPNVRTFKAVCEFSLNLWLILTIDIANSGI